MQMQERECNFTNWLWLYKHYLEEGYKVRLKSTIVNGETKLSIVYWKED